MNTSWFAFLSPPKISSYEHEQRARLLYYMLMAVLIGALVTSISNYLNGWIPESVILSLLTLVCLGGVYLNYTHRYILAASIFCTSFYVIISILLYQGAGLYDGTILAYPVFMICVAFLFGTRGLFIALTTSILAVLTIYLLQIAGLFESSYHASLLRVAIVSLLFAAMAMVTWIVRTSLDGVSTAESEHVDLILLDINLPDIDGYEVARRLRSSSKRQLSKVPIIAVTANALKGDAEKALDAGCDVYMSKPINIRELWARVEAFVPTS